MYESLEAYLKEISHYLAVRQGAEEILAEIRSHILEKAEHEAGAVTEQSLRETIASYGRPQDVASKYVEGHDIISPTFKKYLFRYTAMLFSVHAVLTVAAVYFQMSIVAIPCFFIPKMTLPWAFIYLPMALVYDFGLVALVLYWVTQSGKKVRLPWLGLSVGRRGESGLKRPKRRVLVGLLVLFFVLCYFLARYHTIFFFSSNHGPFEAPFNPAASTFYSIMFIAALGCHIVSYWLRFLFNSAWVTLVENGIVLLILWVVWNSPIKAEYKSVPGFDMHIAGALFVLVLIVIVAFRFLASLVRVRREMSLA
jgi:hypothetical protein